MIGHKKADRQTDWKSAIKTSCIKFNKVTGAGWGYLKLLWHFTEMHKITI